MFSLQKLSLGSAQFGLNYGISNTKGKTKKSEISGILKLAKQNNINTLDTAIDYGNSEERLGMCNVQDWNIISKISNYNFSVDNNIPKNVENSLKRLKVNQLDGILLHNSKDLMTSKKNLIFKSLNFCKDEGLVRKIGVSGYDPKDILYLLENFDLDIIQLPLNIFNRELISNEIIKEIKSHKVEIHVRSVFLQGLLLMNKENVPTYFNKWSTLFDDWNNWLISNEISPLEACLNFIKQVDEVDKIILGIETRDQLKEIIETLIKVNKFDIPHYLSSNDKLLTNPSYWNI